MVQLNATGNVGQNSKISKVGESDCLCFSICSNEKKVFKNQTQEVAQWVDCFFYGSANSLEKLQHHIVKGAKIFVSGKANFAVNQNQEVKIYLTVSVLDIVQFSKQPEPNAEIPAQ